MTAPRIASFAAFAASLLFIILTITQANGLPVTPDVAPAALYCADGTGSVLCTAELERTSVTR